MVDEVRVKLIGRLVAGAALLAALAYLAVSFGSFRGLALAVDHAPRAFVDFVYVYYPAGRAILQEGEVVQGFFYSPFFAMLMVPIAGLPDSLPLFAWIGVQLAATLALGLAGLRLVPGRPAWVTVAYAGFFPLSFPILHSFSWGQVSTLLVAFALWGLLLVERKRPVLGGALLGLAAAIKYYPLVLAFPWLIGRQWRGLVACALLLAIALLVLPAAFLGGEGTLAFYDDVAAMIEANEELLREDVNSQYFPHVLARWADRDPDSTAVLPRIAWLVVWSSLGLVLALSVQAARADARRPLTWGFVLVLLATPFWVPTSWPHYFVYLPFVQLFLVSRALEESDLPRLLRLSVGILAALSTLLSSVLFFEVMGGKEFYGASGTLFVSNALLLVASVAWLFTRLKKAPLVESEELERGAVK